MIAAIDWGNSNTVVSFSTGKSVHIIEHSSKPFLPSYLYYNKSGVLDSIGIEAKNHLGDQSGYVISGIKRLIGVSYDDQALSIGRLYGLEMRASKDNGVLIRVGDQTWKSPEDIAIEYFAELVSQLKFQAKDKTSWFGQMLGKHNIIQYAATHPAHYLGSQSSILRQCIASADLELVDFIPEPVAAGRSRKARANVRTLVIDWGGGTLDFALINSNGECEYLNACQEGCGGVDMDHAIITGLQENKRLPEELTNSDFAVTRVFVEKMKEELLSSNQPAPVTRRLSLSEHGQEFDLSLSLDELKAYIKPLLERAKSGIRHIRFTIPNKNKPDECILVGGPFRSLYIAREICKIIGKISTADVGNPMTAVSVGALRSVSLKSTNGIVVLPHDYGFMTDLDQHKMGPLLIRSQSACPTESPEKEIELWGTQGQLIKCALWVRKADPTTCTDSYESSTEFFFLPTFNKGRAKIRVRLVADENAVITARVVDANTNQEMNLRQVGNGLTMSIQGPPCRTKFEISGLELLKCWRAYHHSKLDRNGLMSILLGSELSAPSVADNEQNNDADMERFIRSWLSGDIDYWKRARRLANHTVQLVEKEIDASERRVTDAIDAVERLLEDHSDTSDAATVRLINALQPLYVLIVQHLGKTHVVEQLRRHDLYEADKTFGSRVDRLAQLFSLFSERQFQRMVVACSEVKNDLIITHMNDPVQEIFEPIETVVCLRGEALLIKDVLNNRMRGSS